MEAILRIVRDGASGREKTIVVEFSVGDGRSVSMAFDARPDRIKDSSNDDIREYGIYRDAPVMSPEREPRTVRHLPALLISLIDGNQQPAGAARQ